MHGYTRGAGCSIAWFVSMQSCLLAPIKEEESSTGQDQQQCVRGFGPDLASRSSCVTTPTPLFSQPPAVVPAAPPRPSSGRAAAAAARTCSRSASSSTVLAAATIAISPPCRREKLGSSRLDDARVRVEANAEGARSAWSELRV